MSEWVSVCLSVCLSECQKKLESGITMASVNRMDSNFFVWLRVGLLYVGDNMPKNNFGPKNIFLGAQKFLGGRNFFWVRKDFWVRKIFGSEAGARIIQPPVDIWPLLTDSFFYRQTLTHSDRQTLLLIGRASATPRALQKYNYDVVYVNM